MNKKTAESILSIFKDCVFDGELTEYSFEEKILKHLPEDLNYDYHYGATKIVFILPDKDFVIKIPFSGQYIHKEVIKKTETGKVCRQRVSRYIEFEGAESPICGEGRGWNYCQVECDIYALAESETVEEFFAKTECIGFIHDYPIYIQETAKIYKDMYPFRDNEEREYKEKYTKKEIKTIDSLCEKYHYYFFNVFWLCDAFNYYGQEKGEKLLSFIKTARIEDLHKSNIGYIGEKPVIIDYAGFNEYSGFFD